MISARLDGLDQVSHDVCVVGAGTVGIVLALELARRGRTVLLLESGAAKATQDAQRLADAEIVNPHNHVPMDIAVARQLGGASNLWGGRCVAMEPFDFKPRAAVPYSGWPIGFDNVAPHLEAACEYLSCGPAVFDDPLPGIDAAGDGFLCARLERWSKAPRLGAVYWRALRDHPRIDLRLQATAVKLELAGNGQVTRVHVRGPGGTSAAFTPQYLVLTAGGLENARLLLATQRHYPGSFGGENGPLGRYYMGHLYGLAAQMTIHSPALDAGLGYYLKDGTYVRRRFTPSPVLQQRMGLANSAFWPDYPPIYDPIHANGILSFAYLSLSVPWIGRRIVVESIRRHYVGPTGQTRWLPHVKNVLRDAWRTGVFIPQFVYRHYVANPRMPGFFQRNPPRRYSVRFHAEHLPNPESRVTLIRATDSLGLPRLKIDFRYTEADAGLLLRAHGCFGEWLQRNGLGTLSWDVPEQERVAHVIDQCYDGHHQIGLTRMSGGPRGGVVDADCRVFGTPNLFVAGSSVFPTSAEANPTLLAITLVIRLAGHLAAMLERHPGSDIVHGARAPACHSETVVAVSSPGTLLSGCCLDGSSAK
jgi:choline dehydrogenase-like flavoprotein